MRTASEEWRDINGTNGTYQVSSYGRVRSMYQSNRYFKTRRDIPLILKPSLKAGYRFVMLRPSPSIALQPMIHRLVAEHFIGPCPPGHECCHKDGTRTNNAAGNLMWGSRKTNAEQREAHRTVAGIRHQNARISERQIEKASKLHQLGYGWAELSRGLGLSASGIREAVMRYERETA